MDEEMLEAALLDRIDPTLFEARNLQRHVRGGLYCWRGYDWRVRYVRGSMSIGIRVGDGREGIESNRKALEWENGSTE